VELSEVMKAWVQRVSAATCPVIINEMNFGGQNRIANYYSMLFKKTSQTNVTRHVTMAVLTKVVCSTIVNSKPSTAVTDDTRLPLFAFFLLSCKL
jgi:hypothetical protein